MINEIEDGMGFAGLVQTKVEQSAEDAFWCERAAYERMLETLSAEITGLRGVILEAHARLSPLTCSPTPNLMTIRDVVDILRRRIKHTPTVANAAPPESE